MKKSIKGLLLLMLVMVLAITGCGKESEEAPANEMNYISVEDTKEALDANDEDYVFLDVRTAEKFEEGHIDGFVSADMDGANKKGDFEDGKAKMEEALGTDKPASDKKYVLLCNTGKSYAQAGTDVLIDEMGVSPESIFTIEGGMEAWQNAGDDYKALIVK